MLEYPTAGKSILSVQLWIGHVENWSIARLSPYQLSHITKARKNVLNTFLGFQTIKYFSKIMIIKNVPLLSFMFIEHAIPWRTVS